MWRQTFAWIIKEIQLEFRNPNQFYALLLYAFSSIIVIYLSFRLRGQSIAPLVWHTLFWIIILFTSFQVVIKSFAQERPERLAYYYTICNPQVFILAKMFYNAGLILSISLLSLGIYTLLFGNPTQDSKLFSLNVVLGSISLSNTLTMISGIASKTNNAGTLVAILGFPVVVPIFLMLLKISKNALDGLEWAFSYDEIAILLAINAIVISLSYILFPFLWRR
ncbi:MAG: heme exporter protein CcmB [Microscillaceae bacterium]|nr:heme exporter protein CcmB [Microscillaceae bacterium]MDW8459820.1 heme exporter protein CcmB [Cytophagales bacterium]